MKKHTFVLALLWLSLSASSAHAAITLSKDFNTGTLTQGVFSTASLCNQPHDGMLSSDFAPDGGKSFRAETRKTDIDCFGFRAEMHISMYRPEMQSAEWFAFDTYVPLSQPDDDRPEGFAQYQANTAVGSPPWGLWYEDGQYILRQYFRPTVDGTPVSRFNTISGSYPRGQWHRWVIHYKRSIGADGLMELWVNGVKKVSITGPNANLYQSLLEPTGYFKFGIYKWVNSGDNPSTQDSRVVYIDNVKLGDSRSTIADFITTTPPPTPDTTLPTISMVAPTSTTVSGNLTLTATAADNVGVTKVEFYRDGGTAAFVTDTTSPYTTGVIDTKLLSNGVHTFSARAYDAAGNTRTSTVLSLTVNNITVPTPDTTLPTVAMVTPTSTIVSGSITLTATASDNVGVTSVSFYQGSTLIGTDTTNPYTATWNTALVANGSYSITARAVDAAGNTRTSTVLSLTVNNVTVPVPTPDTTLPTVTLTSPLGAATVSGTITVTATASDNIGVVRVEFYKDSDTSAFATDTSAPYTASFNTSTLANGAHTFKATAVDAAGNRRTSTIASVTVSNGGGTPSNPTTPTTPTTPSTPTTPTTPSPGGGGGGGGAATDDNSTSTVPGCAPGFKFSPINGKPCTGVSGGGAFPTHYDFGSTTLRVGSRGEGVKELQRFLNRFLNLGLKIDGILGPKTIAVMKTWQSQHGLVPDGLIGPKTKAMMNQIAATQ